MSKSYRKPYSAITGVRSSHDDKTAASRAVRRAQNHALRNAIANGTEWEDFMLPEVYECSSNNVYGWTRDGNQRLQSQSQQYNNPFAYVVSPTWMTAERIMERWHDRMQRDDDWLKEITRK